MSATAPWQGTRPRRVISELLLPPGTPSTVLSTIPLAAAQLRDPIPAACDRQHDAAIVLPFTTCSAGAFAARFSVSFSLLEKATMQKPSLPQLTEFVSQARITTASWLRL